MTRYRLRQRTTRGWQYYQGDTVAPTLCPDDAAPIFDIHLARRKCDRLSGHWEIEEFSPNNNAPAEKTEAHC